MIIREINLKLGDKIDIFGMDHLNGVFYRTIGDAQPIRFVITKTEDHYRHCEIGIVEDVTESLPCIFDFDPDYYYRHKSNNDEFNTVLMIPTGIGAQVGGHAGDAGAVARLIGSGCDNLITHPNVVNGSDINEMPGHFNQIDVRHYRFA
jgi:hypothetical protein